jgi:hypothetical protein
MVTLSLGARLDDSWTRNWTRSQSRELEEIGGELGEVDEFQMALHSRIMSGAD